MTTAEKKEAKVRRALRKKPQTAAEIAKRAGLLASDGSGRGIARELSGLVQAGAAIRHTNRTHSTYTSA